MEPFLGLNISIQCWRLSWSGFVSPLRQNKRSILFHWQEVEGKQESWWWESGLAGFVTLAFKLPHKPACKILLSCGPREATGCAPLNTWLGICTLLHRAWNACGVSHTHTHTHTQCLWWKQNGRLLCNDARGLSGCIPDAPKSLHRELQAANTIGYVGCFMSKV